MTQEEIRAQRELLQGEIADLTADYKGQVGIRRAKLNALEFKCKHPSGYATSCMGESGWYCPDCGYSR